jgi:hypothetical protein
MRCASVITDVIVVMDIPLVLFDSVWVQGTAVAALGCGMRFKAWQAMESGQGVGCAMARASNGELVLNTSAARINTTAPMPMAHFSAAGCGP